VESSLICGVDGELKNFKSMFLGDFDKRLCEGECLRLRLACHQLLQPGKAFPPLYHVQTIVAPLRIGLQWMERNLFYG